MTPRRHETRVPGSQPIRFYKIVAITFLILTIALLAIIAFMSSKRATITIVTKNTPVEINRTLEVGEQAQNGIEGIVTSSEFIVSKIFSPTGEKEEIGKAGGEVTLHNESSADQVLVATTRLLTPDNVLFKLVDRVTVPAGGTVKARVEAGQEGVVGEIGLIERFTIPGLSESSQKLIYASSETPMKGGIRQIGIISEEDLKKAQKILDDEMMEQANEYFTSLYPDKKVVLKQSDGKTVESDVEIGAEVSEFNLTSKAEVAAVFYNQDDLIKWLNEILRKRAIDESEKIELSGGVPTVSLSEYSNGKGVLNVIYTGIASINTDSQQLKKQIFYGKTKDEVRKYLLLLDHVNSVDIVFKPAWMRTIPHVDDRVSIIIKDVK